MNLTSQVLLVLLTASVFCGFGAAFGRWVDAPHDGNRPALGWLSLALFATAVTVVFVTGVHSL